MKTNMQTGARANCQRCGREMQVAAARDEKSWPFKLATAPKGFCADCVMTLFLYNTYPINMQLDQSGPGILLHPQMREAVLMSGLLDNCDLKVDEIIWQRVVDNWELPVECKTGPTNPYRMGDATRDRQSLRELEDAVVAGTDLTTKMLESVGCDPEEARDALERDGAIFLHAMGMYRTKDLIERHRLRSILENCRFCRGRGCLSCETQHREAKRKAMAETVVNLDVDGSTPEADENGILKCSNRVM